MKDCPLHELPLQPTTKEGCPEVLRCPNPRCSIEYTPPKEKPEPTKP